MFDIKYYYEGGVRKYLSSLKSQTSSPLFLFDQFSFARYISHFDLAWSSSHLIVDLGLTKISCVAGVCALALGMTNSAHE